MGMKNAGITSIALLLLLPLGCGGASTPAPATTIGASVLAAGVSQVTVRELGEGYGPATPVGAPCQLGADTYTAAADPATHVFPATLAFSFCRVSGDYSQVSSYTPASGLVTLDPSAQLTLRTAIAAVTVSDRRTCGADKGLVELEVDDGTNSVTYGDDFYGCSPNYQQFVRSDDLDNLLAVAGALSGE
jgi:hypothetical protein